MNRKKRKYVVTVASYCGDSDEAVYPRHKIVETNSAESARVHGLQYYRAEWGHLKDWSDGRSLSFEQAVRDDCIDTNTGTFLSNGPEWKRKCILDQIKVETLDDWIAKRSNTGEFIDAYDEKDYMHHLPCDPTDYLGFVEHEDGHLGQLICKYTAIELIMVASGLLKELVTIVIGHLGFTLPFAVKPVLRRKSSMPHKLSNCFTTVSALWLGFSSRMIDGTTRISHWIRAV